MTDEEYNELVRGYYDLVFKKMVNEMRGDIESAQDLTQLIFLKAWKGRKQFRGDSKPSSWLYTIAQNEMLMYFRRVKSKIYQHIDNRDIKDIPETEYKDHVAAPDLPVNPKIFNSLNEIQKAVFTMRLLEYTTKDISDISGWTQPKIKSAFHRARLKVRANVLRGEPKQRVKARKPILKPGVKKLPSTVYAYINKTGRKAKVYSITPRINCNKGTSGTGDIKKAANG